jgi:hypothetical protein
MKEVHLTRVNVEFGFVWNERGDIRIDEFERLVFPSVSAGPGLYRFCFVRDHSASVYIGETIQLNRRFQQYRTPGIRQQTNLRLNRDICDALKAGRKVTASVLTEIDAPELELTRKHDRVLLEHGAIMCARIDGQEILNS